MRSLFVGAALGIAVLGAVTPASPARKPKIGVFGKIDGMKFRSTGKKLQQLQLLQASYTVDTTLGFSNVTLLASELPKARGTFQNILLTCLAKATAPPWTADCVATYSEVQVKHRNFVQKIWLAPIALDAGGIPVGSFHVTVDSFDGAIVRGHFSGSFASSQLCSPITVCAEASDLGSVSGEGTFTLPAS